MRADPSMKKKSRRKNCALLLRRSVSYATRHPKTQPKEEKEVEMPSNSLCWDWGMLNTWTMVVSESFMQFMVKEKAREPKDSERPMR